MFFSSKRLTVSSTGNKIKKIKPLNEEAAISAGADFLGSFIIYTLSAGTVIFEVWRNNKNKKVQERKKTKKRKVLADKLQLLSDDIENLKHKIEKIEKKVDSKRNIYFSNSDWLRNILHLPLLTFDKQKQTDP